MYLSLCGGVLDAFGCVRFVLSVFECVLFFWVRLCV